MCSYMQEPKLFYRSLKSWVHLAYEKNGSSSPVPCQERSCSPIPRQKCSCLHQTSTETQNHGSAYHTRKCLLLTHSMPGGSSAAPHIFRTRKHSLSWYACHTRENGCSSPIPCQERSSSPIPCQERMPEALLELEPHQTGT